MSIDQIKNLLFLSMRGWRAWLALAICSLPYSALAVTAPTAGQDRGAKVVLAASEYDYPPYCIVNPNGQADGFSVELLRASLKAMGQEVTFQLGPWNEVKQSLVDGRVQVLPLVGRTPEREKLFDFTFPYLTMHGTIVVRDDSSSSIKTLSDLAGKRVAVMRGDNAEEFVRRSNLGATLTTTSTFEEALRELSEGGQDAVIIQKLVALQLMKHAGLSNLRTVGPPLQDFQQSFCFAVRGGDKELLRILNEGLSLVFADGTFRHLHAKWFAPIENSQTSRRRIIVGGDSQYPPYEYLDKNGEPTGYNVDLTKEIAQQLGIDVAFRLGPWNEIRSALAQNEIDVVQGMFYSPEREKTFDFSPAHTVITHAVVVRRGSPMPLNLGELAGKSILVMEGDIMHDAAVELGYAAQLIPVATQEEALRLLASGQGDCALIAKIPALYWIEQWGWKNLQVSDYSVRSPEYSYGFPKNNDHLAALFSEGLANLKATGEYRRIYSKWLGAYDADELIFEKAVKFSLWIVTPTVLLLLGSLIWSRVLRRTVLKRTVELRQEITERKNSEAQLKHLSTHDALTSLANRMLLADRLEQSMHYAQRSGRMVGVLLLDLDRFKIVNDSLGHAVGDQLLIEVARRLRQSVREVDTVARLGGDEFVLLVTEMETIEDASLVATKVLGKLSNPYKLEGRDLSLTASLGISIYPRDGSDGEMLIRNADAAMYQSKRNRSTFSFYAQEMNQTVLATLELEGALRHALERGEFSLHYQPQVLLPSGEILGCEALIRWNHPVRGMISPAEFIPLAEETGLIDPIGAWVIQEACRQAMLWRSEGLPELLIAVNLSARQFRNSNLPQQIKTILADTGMEPNALDLELTESMVMDDPIGARQMMQNLKGLGLSLSLDDFGTGYSSLNYLRQFPVDTLKIDRSFIRDIVVDPSGASVVTSIIDIAHNLGLKAVAEGVETQEQLEFLIQCKCDSFQGFLFSKPLPAEGFSALLRGPRAMRAN